MLADCLLLPESDSTANLASAAVVDTCKHGSLGWQDCAHATGGGGQLAWLLLNCCKVPWSQSVHLHCSRDASGCGGGGWGRQFKACLEEAVCAKVVAAWLCHSQGCNTADLHPLWCCSAYAACTARKARPKRVEVGRWKGGACTRL